MWTDFESRQTYPQNFNTLFLVPADGAAFLIATQRATARIARRAFAIERRYRSREV